MWYREPPPLSAWDDEIEAYLEIERSRNLLLAFLLYGEDDEKNEDEGNEKKES